MRGRPRGHRPGFYLVIALLAVLTSLLLAEAGLRLSGWLLLRSRATPPPGEGQITILCVGDSWTFGAESGGPERFSYPARLQSMLDERAGKGRYRVVNEGRPGDNGIKLIQRLPDLLERYKPHLLVAIFGGVWTLADEVRNLGGADDGPGSGWGPLGSLRVVRLLRLLLRQPELMSAGRLIRQDEEVRRVMTEKLSDRHPDLEDRGVPLIPFTGCSDHEKMKRALRVLRSSPRSVTGGIAALVQEHPGCVAAWVTGAELCIKRRDYACARRFSRQALILAPAEPHALLVRILASKAKAGRWTREAWQDIHRVRVRYPRYLRARRLNALIATQRGTNMCYIKADLEEVLASNPGCTWARRALKAANGFLGDSLFKELHKRTWAHLSKVAQLSRRGGVPLVLLNYPDSQLNPCLGSISKTIARFASARDIPRVDLRPVLGLQTRSLKNKNFAPGGHPNRRGYRLMARAVLRKLHTIGLVDPPK